MTESLSKHERTLSALIHGSTLSRFFIPFGQFIVPLVLWLSNRNQHEFVDYNGKQALNFQISMTLYNFLAGIISIPFFIGFLPGIWNDRNFHWEGFGHLDFFDLDFGSHWVDFPFFWWPLGVAGIVGFGLFIVNIVYTILATIRTSEGQYFKYPITIKFIK